MITTTEHSTKRTTNPTPTLRHQPTAIRLSTSTTPPLHTSYNTSPLPINPNPPSSTTAKSETNTLRYTIQTLATHLPLHPQSPQLHLQTKITHESRQTLQ